MKSETSKGPIRGLSDDSLLDDDSSRAPVGIKPSLPSANPILLTLIIGPLTPKQGSRDGLGPASALVRFFRNFARSPSESALETGGRGQSAVRIEKIFSVRRPNTSLMNQSDNSKWIEALKLNGMGLVDWFDEIDGTKN